MEDALNVTMHIDTLNQTEAMKYIKGKLSDINKMKIEEQKKAIRIGYDMDIIPPDIETYSEEAHGLLKEMQSRNERLFKVTFLITSFNDSLQKMKDFRFTLSNNIQSANCVLRKLDHQQEQGFMSSLPIGKNFIKQSRYLTTSSTAVFVPFTTQELFMESSESLYMGLNSLSNGMIMADRKMLKNPNGLILGTPGSGKSFATKREILNTFLVTTDDILICDPEAEYYPLVNYLGGQIIKIGQSSKQYINPLDINLNYSDDDDPVSLKADFILSFMELVVGGKAGLKPEEKSAIDFAVSRIYGRYFEDPKPEKMPILQDLYDELLSHKDDAVSQHIAQCMYLYVEGSNNLFNHRTNVDMNNRIVCFDIKSLGKTLKKLGMLVVQDAVWNRVTVNREMHKYTRFYIDEFHLLLKDELTAAYSMEIWKRFRKWGGIPTGITQNVKDFLASKEIENIFDNSDFVYMLNQGSDDRDILAQKLDISQHQIKYVTNVGQGEGLIFFGDIVQPFVDRFPKDTVMYTLLTTKPAETKTETETEAEKKNTSDNKGSS
jgi:type IV secretory pathway VirB4 component